MKKVFILGFALLLFSCSQEDDASAKLILQQDVNTTDINIGYVSPYNDKGYPNGRLEEGTIDYHFKNETNLDLKIKPFFSLAFCDFNLGDTYDDVVYRGAIYLGDPNDVLYTPHLVGNSKKFGNYLDSNILQPFTLKNASITLSSTNPDTTVPIQSPSSSFVDGFDFYQAASNGIATTIGEEVVLANYGKLFYVQAEVFNNGVPVESTYLKANFPDVSSSLIYSNTGDWRTLYNDSFFGEKMVYNIHTSEICIPNTEQSTYTSKKVFTYAGKVYEMGMDSTSKKVEVYLKEI